MLSSHRSRSVKANVQVSEQCAAKDKNDVDLKIEFGTFRQNKIEGSTPILKLAMVKRLHIGQKILQKKLSKKRTIRQKDSSKNSPKKVYQKNRQTFLQKIRQTILQKIHQKNSSIIHNMWETKIFMSVNNLVLTNLCS